MERNKKNLRERGITLVALIITIIVMLILVAVTVTIAVESNLIDVAETAGGAYENAHTKDQIQAENVGIEGDTEFNTLQGYVDKYLEGYTCSEHAWVSANNRTCSECGVKLMQVGFFEIGHIRHSYYCPEDYTWGQLVSDPACKTEGLIIDGNYIYNEDKSKILYMEDDEGNNRRSIEKSERITSTWVVDYDIFLGP